MKKAMIAATVWVILAAPAIAADNAQTQPQKGANFEQLKAEVLKRIDERITRNQEEKACVQAAKNRDEFKACRDKFKAAGPVPEPQS